MDYKASEQRYKNMRYNRCGNSGLQLHAISLGLWQNFGDKDNTVESKEIIFSALDSGINYIDLANNYGPPPGTAEKNFGKIIKDHLRPYRDELIISTKAGYTMWEGPCGDWGSRKSLIASCDQSLKRMGLEYVDIFYSHRYDPNTPLEETMGALDYIVRSGRAIYAALSNYPPEQFIKATEILKSLGTPCVAHQIKYSMLVRNIGDSLFELQQANGVGCISYSPLAQGLLSDRYLNGIPSGSRASRKGSLSEDFVTNNIDKVARLNDIAHQRGQSLAQMAIAWQLYDNRVQSVIVGVSSASQLADNLKGIENINFTESELIQIKSILEE